MTSYTKTIWANGSTPAISAANLDNIENGIDSSHTELQAHLDDTTAAHAGTAISNTPAGNISAVTTQAAIDELDTEKVAKSGDTMTGDLEFTGVKKSIKNFGNDRTFSTSTFADLDLPAFLTYGLTSGTLKNYFGMGQITDALGFVANQDVGGSIQFFTGNLSSTGGSCLERMRISSDGKVGIGAIPSNAILHLGAGNDSLRIGAVNFVGSAADTTTYDLERSRNQILFSTYRDSLPDKIGAKIVGINKQTYTDVNNRHLIQSADLVFYTVPPNTTNYDDTVERLRIMDDGTIDISGNITIASGKTVDGVDISTIVDANDRMPTAMLPTKILNSYWHASWDERTNVQNTWIQSLSSAQTDHDPALTGAGDVIRTTPAADGDEIHFGNLAFNAGTYKVIISYRQYDGGGIIEVLHGTTSLGTADGYSASVTFNNVATFTYSPTTYVTGNLRLKVTGKNGSSAGYAIWVSRIEIIRTA